MLFWSSMFSWIGLAEVIKDSHSSFHGEGNPIFMSLSWIPYSAHSSLHSIEGGPVLEPIDLLGVESVVQHNSVRATVSVCQHAIQGHSWSKRFEADNGNPVVRLNQLIVCLVVEGQRQHTLLLQVVLVTKHHPVDAGFFVLPSHIRHTSKSASILVLLLVLRVDGGDQQVVADVLQVATVLQPGPGGRDVVGGALALNLDQDSHVGQIRSDPLVEGSQQLQPVGGGGDINNNLGAICRWMLVGVLAGVETSLGE